MPNPYKYVRFCAWGGPVLLVGLIVFWGVLGSNIPPYSAALDAQAIADHYRHHTTNIRIGMIVTMMLGVLYLVWGMAITKVMEAVEWHNDVLSRLQLWGAGFTALILVFPPAIWLAAAFRPDQLDPSIIQMLYDTGWIVFDLAFTLTALQLVAIGVCFLSDRRAVPVIPKWVSWLCLWIAFMFLMLFLMPFFKDGPFSRSGIVNYWVEFILFFLFMQVMSLYTFRALNILEHEHAEAVKHG